MDKAREAALAAGETHYHGPHHGPPCKRGHCGLRYAASRHCVKCTHEARQSRDEWKSALAKMAAEVDPLNAQARADLLEGYRTGKMSNSKYRLRSNGVPIP
jgi:hypothetical protein